MQKFLDFLRKLGIFRSGSVSGTYTSEKDRPTEFLMDDVYDAKKDLTTKEDIKKVVGAVAASAVANPGKASMGRKIFFWIMVVVGIFFLIGFLSSGFSFSFIIFLILWGILIFMLRKFAFLGMYSLWMMIVVAIVIFFFSLMLFPSSGDQSDSSSADSSGKSLSQYDKKIFDLSSADGKLKGTAAIQVKKNNKGKDYLSVTYHIKVKDNIPMNTSIACGNAAKIPGYNYVGNLLTPLSQEKSNAVGSFSQAYCNKDAWPEDLFGFSDKTYQCPKPVTAGTATDTFVPNFSENFYSLEEFMAANNYEVYDGASAWVENENGDGCSLKDDLAVSQGKKARTYTFTLTERK